LPKQNNSVEVEMIGLPHTKPEYKSGQAFDVKSIKDLKKVRSYQYLWLTKRVSDNFF
jgi:hypothetical protein